MDQNTDITCLLDPLCGWCYGAGPVLGRLALEPGIRLVLAPVGLFAGGNARPMDEGFAAYAWSNDQRIEQLTGQRFSQSYYSKVLQGRGQLFDSGPATLALTSVQQSVPERELEALKAIQEARYVDGQDITATAVLAGILDRLGLETAARRLGEADADLLTSNDRRIAAAQSEMRGFAADGVPALIITHGGQRRLLSGNHLYGSLESLMNTLATI